MDAVAEFLANGGSVKKIEAGVNSGIRSKQWGRMVRGEPEPVEVPIVAQHKRVPGTLKLRCGHGVTR